MGIFKVEKYIGSDTPGLVYQLNNPWLVYSENTNVYKFETIAGFWNLFSSKLTNKRLSVLRNDTMTNDYQSHCYFIVIDLNSNIDSYQVFMKLLLGLIGETLSNGHLINGLTWINDSGNKRIIIWLSNTVNTVDKICFTEEYNDYIFHQNNCHNITYMSFNESKQ